MTERREQFEYKHDRCDRTVSGADAFGISGIIRLGHSLLGMACYEPEDAGDDFVPEYDGLFELIYLAEPSRFYAGGPPNEYMWGYGSAVQPVYGPGREVQRR